MLVASNIYKTYEDIGQPLEVLRGVDLRVEDGDFLALTGPSGAGKSTLLHILGGLDRPTKGKVYLDEDDIYKIHDRKRTEMRNEKIGFVFQFYHLLQEFTALENVILPGLINQGFSDKKILEAKGVQLLEKVDLKERMKHKPNQLSGGEQQRVAIARALMNDPKIILCDEPTGNLDSQSGENILQLLIMLSQSNKQAVVLVTHDQRIANRANKIVHMQDGKLV